MGGDISLSYGITATDQSIVSIGEIRIDMSGMVVRHSFSYFGYIHETPSQNLKNLKRNILLQQLQGALKNFEWGGY